MATWRLLFRYYDFRNATCEVFNHIFDGRDKMLIS